MRYKFEDIIYNITEKKKPTEEDRLNYIGLEHLDSGSLFVSRWGSDVTPEGEKIIMKKGDVLFGKRRAYQKKVAISPIDGVFSAHGMVLRPKENVICKEYLPFFISSDYFLSEAIRISVGGLSPTINWKDIKVLEFDLPSLSEQKLLAEKLWAAYKVKQSYIKMIEATDEMVKSQFVEMFGGDEEVSLSYYVDSLVGGKSLDGGSETSKKVLKTGAVTYDYFDEKEYKYLPDDYTPTVEHRVNPGDVIVSRMNTPEFVGATAYVKEISDEIYIPDRLWKMIPKDNVLPVFLWQSMIQPNTKMQIRNMASGTSNSMKNISKPKLLSVLVKKVDLSRQRVFTAIVEQADKSKFELRKSIEAIDKVIKSLINENL